ncbi:hypothetical protein AWB82_04414 [Caballeronia glebae]|uniref:Cyclic nucleotide-binding domain-containing protein n=1 Tax=Caballeronia glebae TaxID=1777143 RepID=A0A158BSI0_9BURK|nr:DUF2169 domain-containing protein [Caballeronia glebae]SAK72217.1 hypothetical protein AWB82_04414 [Caballeronia glebae]
MWLVINHTSYAADRTWVQDRDANKIWFVLVKATFDILADGTTSLAEKQESVLRVAQPRGKFGESSLIYESDILGLKPATDIVVNGHAWAPNGRPVASVDVGFAVGPVRKILRVFGDRVWERTVMRGIAMSTPRPFSRIPLEYERAFGGWDRTASDLADHRLESRNPVGTGFVCNLAGLDGTRLPNFEYGDRLIASWKDRPTPAGFGPVDCAWSPRRELAGTYDGEWQRTRAPLWATDFDPRYHQCAPGDQQVQGYLRGGEPMRLLNLSASGSLSFRLPRVYPFFETRIGRERIEHRGRLCTVLLEPDVPRVIMTWQTSLVCNDRVDELDGTIVTEKEVL